MILIGRRIFVIFLATRHVCAVICAKTLRGMAHTGILQELEM